MAKLDFVSAIYDKRWNKWLVVVLRFLVGAVFIYSGFVKAIDPWGTVYKFTDYLMSFHIGGFYQMLPVLAFALASVEFVFGAFILFGANRKWAPIFLLAMMAVMLPLTLYLAITDKVADCGCFGDALVISNWTSFWKNVVITLALVYLLIFNKNIRGAYSPAVQWLMAIVSLAFIVAIAATGYFIQPLLDFRPYKVGTPLVSASQRSAMSMNHDEADDYRFIYEKNGVTREFSVDSLPDESWNYVDRRELVKPKAASSSGISVFDEDDDEVTDSVVPSDGDVLLLLFPNLRSISISYTYLINQLNDFAQQHGVGVFGLTSAGKSEIDEWDDLSMASYDIYNIDDSELKMIARGNPAVVFVRDGRVVWKRTLRSISSSRLSSIEDLDSLSSDFNPAKSLSWLVSAYFIAMILVLIINHSHKLVKFTLRRSRKSRNKDVTLHSN
jgi:uncharacterized membrane protein YphA (DoxX/SURF4 family)